MQNWELRTYYVTSGYTAEEFFKDAMAHLYQRSLTSEECRTARNQAEFYEKTGMPESYATSYHEYLTDKHNGRRP